MVNLHAAVAKTIRALPAEAQVTVTLTRTVPGTLNPLTDVETGAGTDRQTVTGGLITLSPERLKDGTIRQRGQMLVLPARQAGTPLAWAPEPGQTVTWGSETLTVATVDPMPNRADPVAYRVEMAR